MSKRSNFLSCITLTSSRVAMAFFFYFNEYREKKRSQGIFEKCLKTNGAELSGIDYQCSRIVIRRRIFFSFPFFRFSFMRRYSFPNPIRSFHDKFQFPYLLFYVMINRFVTNRYSSFEFIILPHSCKP